MGNIKDCNKHPRTILNIHGPWMRWPVNDKPLNTFRTLELLFPIPKKELVLVLLQFPKMIVLNFLLRPKIYHS